MMDFAFRTIDGTGFDLAHDGRDLMLDDGLITALVHSLFRDGRAPSTAIEDGRLATGEDPRGHWSTTLEPGAPDGSLLWLLRREKITPDMPYRVAELMEKACLWMIRATDGPAAPVVAVKAVCRKAATRGRIDGRLELRLTRAPGTRRFDVTYDAISQTYRLEGTN